MKKVISSLMFILLAGCSSTMVGDNSALSEQDHYKYVGIYSDRANEDYKVIIQETKWEVLHKRLES